MKRIESGALDQASNMSVRTAWMKVCGLQPVIHERNFDLIREFRRSISTWRVPMEALMEYKAKKLSDGRGGEEILIDPQPEMGRV